MPKPRNRRRSERRLAPIDPPYYALKFGPGTYQEQTFDEDDVAELWRDYGSTVEDPRSFAAFWLVELDVEGHGLSGHASFAAARLHRVAREQGLDLDDEEIARRAMEDPDFDDPRRS